MFLGSLAFRMKFSSFSHMNFLNQVSVRHPGDLLPPIIVLLDEETNNVSCEKGTSATFIYVMDQN